MEVGLFYAYGIELNEEKVVDILLKYFDSNLSDFDKKQFKKYQQYDDKNIEYRQDENYPDVYYNVDYNKSEVIHHVRKTLYEFIFESNINKITINNHEFILSMFPHGYDYNKNNSFSEEYYLGVMLTSPMYAGVCNYAINDIFRNQNLTLIDDIFKNIISDIKPQLMLIPTGCYECDCGLSK